MNRDAGFLLVVLSCSMVAQAALEELIPAQNILAVEQLKRSPNRKEISLRGGPARVETILNLVDGRFVKADKIRKMKFISQEMIKMQYGVLDTNTKQRVGMYNFKGQWFTIKKFVKLEQYYQNKYKNLRESSTPDDRIKYEKMMAPLLQELEKVKSKYRELTKDYIGEARGTKEFMVDFIELWSQLAGAPDSLLRGWAKASDEHESLNKNVLTWADLDGFFTDLLDFFSAFWRSLPIAMRLYHEKYDKKT